MVRWWDTCHQAWQPELVSRPHVVERTDSYRLSADLYSPVAPHTTQSKQMDAPYPSTSFPMPLYSPSTSKKRNNFFINCIFHIFIQSYSLHIGKHSISMWRLHHISFGGGKHPRQELLYQGETISHPMLCQQAGHWNYKVRSLCVIPLQSQDWPAAS